MSPSAGLGCHDTIRVVMTDGGLSLNALAISKPRITCSWKYAILDLDLVGR